MPICKPEFSYNTNDYTCSPCPETNKTFGVQNTQC